MRNIRKKRGKKEDDENKNSDQRKKVKKKQKYNCLIKFHLSLNRHTKINYMQ